MLKWLYLDDCKKLVSLTELPPSVLYLKAVNCTYLDTDYTQRLLLENMLQAFSKDTPNENEGVDAISFFPGAQVPCMFDF
ncbi:putative disease resistance protein (TIR-NBS-LRR class), partial [Trifolium medium]|nr:putative disease resistance protein (TIR-NBS-LRR class) [Trifolium medium]